MGSPNQTSTITSACSFCFEALFSFLSRHTGHHSKQNYIFIVGFLIARLDWKELRAFKILNPRRCISQQNKMHASAGNVYRCNEVTSILTCYVGWK